MKALSLDIGDAWIGMAISDSGHSHSFPYKTVPAKELTSSLPKIIKTEGISTIIFGLPKTLKGSLGNQSKKVLDKIKKLQKLPNLEEIKWVEIDERFSSQGALEVIHSQNKKIGKNKRQEHSIVAALLLESYLNSLKN